MYLCTFEACIPDVHVFFSHLLFHLFQLIFDLLQFCFDIIWNLWLVSNILVNCSMSKCIMPYLPVANLCEVSAICSEDDSLSAHTENVSTSLLGFSMRYRLRMKMVEFCQESTSLLTAAVSSLLLASCSLRAWNSSRLTHCDDSLACKKKISKRDNLHLSWQHS